MMRILRIGRSVKVGRARAKEVCDLRLKQMDGEIRVELIQALIPRGLWHVNEVLEEESYKIDGRERYAREGILGHDCWRNQGRSVNLSDQKLPVLVPKVRDQRGGREMRLTSYERLQEPRGADKRVLRRILHGLSFRGMRAVCRKAKHVNP